MAETIPDSTTVVIAKEVLASELDSEVVILNLRDGVYYGLDDVGARIWQLLQTPVTVAEICDVLAAEYDVARARCARDTQKLLSDLAARGLIEVRKHA